MIRSSKTGSIGNTLVYDPQIFAGAEQTALQQVVGPPGHGWPFATQLTACALVGTRMEVITGTAIAAAKPIVRTICRRVMPDMKAGAMTGVSNKLSRPN